MSLIAELNKLAEKKNLPCYQIHFKLFTFSLPYSYILIGRFFFKYVQTYFKTISIKSFPSLLKVKQLLFFLKNYSNQ